MTSHGRAVRLALAFGLVTTLAACTGTAGAARIATRTPMPSGAGRTAASPTVVPPTVIASAAGFHLTAPVEREVAVADGGTIYLAGGLDGTGRSASGVFALDPSTGRLTPLGAVPSAFHDAAGAVLDGRLLVFGGGAATSSDQVQAFDLSTDRGAVVGHLPNPISDLTGVAVEGTVYLVGGWNGTTYQRSILATRDGTTFRTVAQLPAGLRYPAVAAEGGALVIAGGEGPEGASGAILRLDLATGRIRRIGRLPAPVAHAAAFAMGGAVDVAGGVNADGRPVRAVTAIDPVSGRTWSAGTLPRPVSDAAVAVDGTETVWLLGGERGHAVNDVEVVRAAASAPAALPTTVLPDVTAPADTRRDPAAVRPFAGLLLIADRGNDRLLVVNAKGHVVWRYPDPSLPAPPVPFYFPDDAFWVHGGHAILVNEEENDVLAEIAYPSGRTLWTYGHPRAPGSSAGYVHQPDDLYPYPGGGMVVADAMNCRILFFDPSGHASHQIGRTGDCTPGLPTTVGYPNGDTPLRGGRLLVTELHGGSISEVRPDGRPLWTVHIPTLDVPSDPQRLPDGTYLAANFSNPGAVVRFRSNGHVVWTYRPTAGAGTLDHPSLAAPLPNGLIALTDDYHDRVVLLDPQTHRIVWQYGHTDVPGSSNGYLHIPDGLDLLLPGGVIPLHLDFASPRVHPGRP